MQRYMELHDMSLSEYGIGEELLNKLNKNEELIIKVQYKSRHNIYGLFQQHLVPISDRPLITPYALMMPLKDLKEIIIDTCNEIKILKKHDTIYIKCFHHTSTIKNYIIYKRIKPNCNKISTKSISYSINILNIMLTLINNEEDIRLLKRVKTLLNDQLIYKNNIIEFLNIFNELLGWGSGSTPSGDDLIIGFLTSIMNKPNHELTSLLHLSKTTWLSASLIKEITNDPYYLISLNALKYDICEGNDDALINDLVNVFKIGSVSGLFMVIGLIIGFIVKLGLFTLSRKILFL